MPKTIAHKTIITDAGEPMQAQCPVIVSASRATDIPAFYSDWFFARLAKGYSAWRNPFSGQRSYVSYCHTRLIVFWSKNPLPLLPKLGYLATSGIDCYVQYTINDYEKEGFEPCVPPLSQRIDTFKQLVGKLGMGSVIWRFDPLLLAPNVSIDDLLAKIEFIGDQLFGYTEKLVFSFVDIAAYAKVRRQVSAVGIREFSSEEMIRFASELSALNKRWNYQISTCGELPDLHQYGINHNKCIDDELIMRLFRNNKPLMDYMNGGCMSADLFGVVHFPQKNKDKGQRKACNCIASKDIGEYNTCQHGCIYCYANASNALVTQNAASHCRNRMAETVTGK